MNIQNFRKKKRITLSLSSSNIRVFLFISKRSLGLLLLFRKNHANIYYPCGRVDMDRYGS